MKTKLVSAFLAMIAVFAFISCRPNEEKIIKNYLLAIENEDGDSAKVQSRKYLFHSFEEIAVDGKFVYSLTRGNHSEISKDAVFEEIKKDIDKKNRELLLSVIYFKRLLDCGVYEWKRELEYKEKSDASWERFTAYDSEAKALGKIYTNFDNQSLYLIKAVYDYKVEDVETPNITKYFVYDKVNNKILKQFDSLEDDFLAYYFGSLDEVDIESYNDFKFDYEELLDRSLEELVNELRIANYELRITNYELRIANYE